MHELKGKHGNVIKNFNEIVKVAGDCYSELHSSQTDHATLTEIESEEDTEIACIATDEVRKTVKSCSAVKQQVNMA